MESRSINTQKKKRGQYPATLTEEAWSIKDLLFGFRGNFSRGTQRIVPIGQDSILVHRAVWFILPAHGASHIIKQDNNSNNNNS